MKNIEDLQAGLTAVSGKKKEDIIAFAQMLISEYGILLVLDVNTELVKLNGEHSDLILQFNSLKEQKVDLEAELIEAQQIAKDAIELANSLPADQGKTFVTIDKVKYELKFGVDGLTKEELAKDADKLKILAKGGSGALIKVEG